MPRFPSQCPSCSGRLQVTRLACPACGMQLEGRFGIHALLHLPPDDQQFVLEFVQASGSLKEMARLRKQSYPTIRNRLDDIIARLRAGDDQQEHRRLAILQAIARGELSVEDGARQLEEQGQ